MKGKGEKSVKKGTETVLAIQRPGSCQVLGSVGEKGRGVF